MSPEQIRVWLVVKDFFLREEVRIMRDSELYALRDYLLGVRHDPGVVKPA